MATSVPQIAIRITADANGAHAELRNLNTSLNTTSASAKKAGAAVQQLSDQTQKFKASLLALTAAATGITSVNEVIGEMIVAKEAVAKLQLSLTVISGSAKDASSDLAWLGGVSERLGLAARETAQIFMGLRAATNGTTLEGEKTRKIFESVTRAMSALGRSTDETAGALKAIEQMVSKGNVQAEELRGQLGERLPGAYGLAARSMGLTGKQLGIMLQMGKVTAEDMLPRLAHELDKLYDTGKEVRTLTAEWNRFKNAFNGIDQNQSLLVVLNDTLKLNEKLSAGLRDATQWVNSFAKALKAGEYDDVILALRGISGALKAITLTAVGAFGALKVFGALKFIALNPFKVVAAGALGAVGAAIALQKEMVNFKGITGTVADYAKAVWLGLKDTIKSALDNPAQALSGFYDGVVQTFQKITAYLSPAWASVIKEFNAVSADTGSTLFASLNTLPSVISAIATNIAQILSGLYGPLLTNLQRIFPQTTSTLTAIGNGFKTLYETVIKPVASSISTTFQNTWKVIYTSFSSEMASSGNPFAAYAASFMSGANSIASSVSSLLSRIITKLKSLSPEMDAFVSSIETALSKLAPAFSVIGDSIASVYSDFVKPYLSLIYNNVTQFVSTFTSGFSSFGSLFDGVGEKVGAVASVFAGLVKIVTGVALAFAQALSPIITEVIAPLAARVAVLFAYVAKVISDNADPIISTFKGLLNIVSGAIVGIGSALIKVADYVIPAIAPVIGAVVGAVGYILKWVADHSEQIVTGIKVFFDVLADIVIGVVKGIVNMAAAWFDAAKTMVDVIVDVGSTIKGVFNEAVAAVGRAFDWVSQKIDEALTAVSSFGNSVASAFGSAGAWIKESIGDSFGWLGEQISSALNAVYEFGAAIADWFGSLFDQMAAALQFKWDFFSGDDADQQAKETATALAGTQQQAQAAAQETQSFLGSIWDFFSGAGTAISSIWENSNKELETHEKKTESFFDRMKKHFAELSAARQAKEEQALSDALWKEHWEKSAKAADEALAKSEAQLELERKRLLMQMEMLVNFNKLNAQMQKTYIGYDELRAKAVTGAAQEIVKPEAEVSAKKTIAALELKLIGFGGSYTPYRLLADFRALGLQFNEVKKQADQATTSFNNVASAYGKMIPRVGGSGKGGVGATLIAPQTQEIQDAIKNYERTYKLIPGILDTIKLIESKTSTNLRIEGPVTKYGTAKGLFQMLDTTFKEYRVDMNTVNGQAEGAAKYVADSTVKAKGNIRDIFVKYVAGQSKTYETTSGYGKNYADHAMLIYDAITSGAQQATIATTEHTAAITSSSSAASAQSEIWTGLNAVETQRNATVKEMAEQERLVFIQRQLTTDILDRRNQAIDRMTAAELASQPVMQRAAVFEDKLARGIKLTEGEMKAAQEAQEEKRIQTELLTAIQQEAILSDKEAVASGAAHNSILRLSRDQLEQVSRKYNSGLYAVRDYRIEMDNISQAYAAGALSTEEYAKAQQQVQLEYQKTQGPMAAYFAGLEESIGSIEGFTVDAMEGFRSALVNGLVDGRFEFDDFVKDIKKKLAEIAINTIMVNVVGNSLGLTNMTPSATANGKTPASDLSAIATIGKLFSGNSMGTTLARGLTTTAGKAGASGLWIGDSASNMMQTSNWQYAAGSIGGSLLGNAIFGNKGQGATGSTVGATLGAIAGSAVPVVGTMLGGLIGGALGGAIGSMFGDDKPRQGNFSTSFSGTGFEDDAKAAGAFGLSFGLADKGSQNIKGADYQDTFDAMAELSKTISSFYGATLANDVQAALNARLGDFNAWGKDLDTSFRTMFTAIIDAADAAEGNVGQGMGHLLKVAVGTLEGDANEAATQIANAIVTVNTAIAMFDTETGRLLGMGTALEFDTVEKSVLGIKQFVVEFARSGEEYADTANRILSSANIFTQAFALSGRALDSVTLSGTEFVAVATQFNDAMASYGFTFDTLSAAQNSYYEAFFTEEERAIKTRDTSLKSIAAWSASIGQAHIDTSAEFRTYVESLDILDEAQQQSYLRAMQLVPVFTALDDALETLKTTANEFVLSLRSDDRIQSDALLEMVTLFDSWNLTLPETSDALYLMIQAGQLTSAQIKILEEDSNDLASAFAALEREMVDLPEFIKSLTPDISVNESALLRIESFFEAWNVQLPQTEAALYELIRAGGLTTEQITLLAKNADDLTAAFAALNVVPDFINSLTTEAASGYSALSAMTNLFAEWNIAMPQTEAALYELIRAGAFTEEQMKLLANNSDLLSGAFSTLNGEMEFVASLQNEAATNESALAGLVNLFAEWGVQLPSSSDALYSLIIAGDLTQEQMRVLAANTELVGNAFDALSTRQSNAVALLQDAYDAGVQNLNALAEARIQGYRDSADADKDALKTAYDARIDSLTKANELIVDGLNDSIDKLKDSVDIFKDVIDSTKSALTALADASDSVGETRQRYLAQARSAVKQYNSGGTLPDNISDIIQELSGVDQQDFATMSAWKSAVGENESVLTQLQKIGVSGKSEAEQQIELLEQQIVNEDENFESLKNLAEKQYSREMYLIEKNLESLIDNENSNRDKSIVALKSGLDAMKKTLMTDTNAILNTTNGILSNMLTTLGTAGASALDATLAANGKANDASNPIVNGGITVSTGTTPIASAVAPVTNKYTTPDLSSVTNPTDNTTITPITFNTATPAPIKPVAFEKPIEVEAITKNPKTEWNEATYLTKNVDVFQAVRNKQITSGLEHFLKYGFNEVKDGKHREGTGLDYVYQFDEAKYLARNTDVADAIANGKINSALEHYVRWGAPESRSPIGAYAQGGYHSGGLRIVGEAGPELEYTGPSHITANHDLGKVFGSGNSDLVKEVKALRAEVRDVNTAASATANTNAILLKLFNRWHNEGLPPDRMDYLQKLSTLTTVTTAATDTDYVIDAGTY